MLAKPLVILALDPGSREFGFALFVQGELHYFGVKTLKPEPRPAAVAREVTRVLTTLLQHYRPQVVALKVADQFQHNTALLHRAAATMKRLAQRQGLAVHEYDARVVRQQICRSRHATKRQAAQCLIACYPVLRRYYQPDVHAKEVYWGRLFAAVSVGVVCWQQLSAQDAEG